MLPWVRVAGDDRVLREEAGEGRDPDEGETADQEHPAREPQRLAEPAHLADVLLAAQRVDHDPGRQEEQRLEEGVRSGGTSRLTLRALVSQSVRWAMTVRVGQASVVVAGHVRPAESPGGSAAVNVSQEPWGLRGSRRCLPEATWGREPAPGPGERGPWRRRGRRWLEGPVSGPRSADEPGGDQAGHDEAEQDQPGLACDVLHAVVARPGHVPEYGEPASPQRAAGDVVEKEGRVVHLQ